MSPEVGLVFLLGSAPICLWIAWCDLSLMRIPNTSLVLLLLVFIVAGPVMLPLDQWGWQLLHLPMILVPAILLNVLRVIGGGDSKMIAVMSVYVPLSDATDVLFIWALATLSSILVHRVIRGLPALRPGLDNWRSWHDPGFPLGVPLAITLILHLVLVAFT